MMNRLKNNGYLRHQLLEPEALKSSCFKFPEWVRFFDTTIRQRPDQETYFHPAYFIDANLKYTGSF